MAKIISSANLQVFAAQSVFHKQGSRFHFIGRKFRSHTRMLLCGTKTPRGRKSFSASAPRPPTGRRRAPSRVTRRLPWNQGRACFCLHETSWQQGCGSRVLLFRLQKHVVSFAGETLFGHSVPLLHQNPHVWPPKVACYAA